MDSKNEESFQIPRHSFTGFRLTYLQTEEISETSKTLLLGKSPHLFGNDVGPGLIRGSIRKAKSKTRRTFESSSKIKSHGVYNEVNEMTGDKPKMAHRFNFARLARKIRNEQSSIVLSSDSEFDNEPESFDHETRSFDNETDSFNNETGFLDSEIELHHDDDYITDVKKWNPESNIPLRESMLGDDTLKTTGIPSNTRPNSTSNTIVNDISRVSTTQRNTFSSFERDSRVSIHSPKTKFKNNATATKRKRKKMALARPEPLSSEEVINNINGTSILDEKEHHYFRKKFKTFAKFSQGRAKTKSKSLRDKVFKSIIKSYAIGEIILKERLLVLTKETLNTKPFSSFNENEPCETRVSERWREFIVTLRKSDHDAISIQFYKGEGGNSEEKPDYEYELTKKMTADFYNHVDKSVFLTIPKDHWCVIHILKFHDQRKSFKWLYFLKQVLGVVLDTQFNVFIPDVKINLSITIPDSVLFESLDDVSTINVIKLSTGYQIKHSPLIQFVLDKIKERVLQSGNQELLEWLKNTISPWFCFKYYDRLEWIIDDSEIFYIQNQILKSHFQLEIRDMSINKRVITTNGSKAPIPIEGFLSRLSDIGGHEQTLMRNFYKLLYFYTCDNLLFFTKYYRALPPKDLNSVNEEIFMHCSYKLDENQHIWWINHPDFLKFDKAALKEFDRRSLLITKADSVIDLNLVLEIRVVPPEELKVAQKLFFSLFWYGSTKPIEDEYLLDSAFEISTSNEGKIKLQAPNRKIRNLWVEKLTEMVSYWKLRKQLEVEKLNEIRSANMNLLKIDEYIDSNISQECGYLELRNSLANPYYNTVDHISLNNSLMISGYLYHKYKKHSNFNQYFVTLSSGNLVLYSLYKRSKVSGEWKRALYFQHHLTIPLSGCYLYSGIQTSSDLLQRHKEIDPTDPGNKSLPRIYSDGWKSSEEETMRCFTLWFGRKRAISKKSDATKGPKNPNLIRTIGRVGITGKSMVFMSRSRQEREIWVSRIYAEIDRYSKLYNL